MTPLETEWQVYGESGLPGWLVAALWLAALVLSLWWLRGERRRRGALGALLPYTWGLLLLLVAWLVWRPTLIKITKWQHRAGVLAYLDQSESMATPLLGSNLSVNLDLLSLWHPNATKERNTTLRDLGRVLEGRRAEAEQMRSSLADVLVQLRQGIPIGEAARRTRESYAPWAAAMKQEVRQPLAEVLILLDSLDESRPREYLRVGHHLEELGKAAELLPAKITEVTRDDLSRILTPLDSLGRLSDEIQSPLLGLQADLDRRFHQAHREALDPLLTQAAKITRLDAAQELIRNTGGKGAAWHRSDEAEQELDVHDGIERLLAEREDEVLSHLLILSDGGHDTRDDTELAKKIERSGIHTIAVGVGSAEPGFDLALRDFRCKRIVKAGRELRVVATLKTPIGRQVPFRLVLADERGPLASVAHTTAGQSKEVVTLSCKAPKEGRHILTVRIEADDASKQNNAVRFAIDSVRTTPRALIIGDLPNWDTTYLYLAAERVGLDVRQIFHGATEGLPKRGGAPGAIPRTLSQWRKYHVVVLQGSAFKGFSEKDADNLFKYVTEEGRALLTMANPSSWYSPSLAERFGWQEAPAAVGDTALKLSPDAQFLPVVRVEADGPTSARVIAALGSCEAAYRVPGQRVSLVENPQGQSLLSIGLYGRGKVYLCGLCGLHKLRGFGRTGYVDRLLEQLVSDAATPLFAGEARQIACYPTLPVRGKKNFLITTVEGNTPAQLGNERRTIPLNAGTHNRVGLFAPSAAGPLAVTIGGVTDQLTVVENPGMEQIYYEFNEARLKEFARESGGRYLTLGQAAPELRSVQPGTWVSATSERYPLSRHWILLCAIAAVGTLHWAFRKLSGLAI